MKTNPQPAQSCEEQSEEVAIVPRQKHFLIIVYHYFNTQHKFNISMMICGALLSSIGLVTFLFARQPYVQGIAAASFCAGIARIIKDFLENIKNYRHCIEVRALWKSNSANLKSFIALGLSERKNLLNAEGIVISALILVILSFRYAFDKSDYWEGVTFAGVLCLIIALMDNVYREYRCEDCRRKVTGNTEQIIKGT